MANSRTNSLHERLPVEIRRQVEEDLVEQPPGRATYAQVFEHYQLDVYGVSLKALERYGGYLRTLARNAWIREFGDVLVGEDLSPKIEGLIRSRLYEAVVSGDADIDDLRRAAMAEKHLRQTRIMTEMWAAKQEEAAAAIAKAETEGREDPAKALANLNEKIRTIYGIGN